MRIITWEIWIAHGLHPCDRCKRFDGQLYRKGEGPQPVRDTHYSCQCQRAFYHHTPPPSWRQEGGGTSRGAAR